jgi:tripartite-type tricarboxylate transporter receptor subunit TctC
MSLPGVTFVPALVNVGKIRALAMTTIDRSPLLLGTPTLHESGFPGYDLSSWAGLLAPAGTPKPIIDRLNSLVTKIGNAGELKNVFEKQGLSVRPTTPQEFTDFIRRELALNKKLAKAAGIQME